MTQYLLSVHSGPDDHAVRLEEMQPVFEAVDALQPEGARTPAIWVFAGGLQPRRAGHDRRRHRRGADRHRRPVRGVQGVDRRLLGLRGPRPGRRAAAGRPRARRRARGKVEVRPFQDEPA